MAAVVTECGQLMDLHGDQGGTLDFISHFGFFVPLKLQRLSPPWFKFIRQHQTID